MGEIDPTGRAALASYLAAVERVPLLSADEERRLARAFREQGDARAGHLLVTSNLRFVVRVALGYRGCAVRISDLVQEGNLGLMKAVERFDPDRQARLISFAVWWIRAYIQRHILGSWSMVRHGGQHDRWGAGPKPAAGPEPGRGTPGPDPTGTAAGAAPPGAQRRRGRRGARPSGKRPAREARRRDVSLDETDENGDSPRLDAIEAGGPLQDDALSTAEEAALLSSRVRAALEVLDPRERRIVEERLMADDPTTLECLGRRFGFTRERTRQLESRAVAKLRHALGPAAPPGWC
jgi:RNA polymerase sigma-32 factor